MAARDSFSSHDHSNIVTMPLPESVLLKDYLLDDLSSCSSNGFRSYPRRQCCTKVRYLIEIDLNKHIKLPPSQKQFLKSKLKLKKSSPVLHRASAAVINVFKKFRFSSSGANFLPSNLSRKLSRHGFGKRTTDQVTNEFKKLNLFDEPLIKRKENILPPALRIPVAKSNSNNSSASLESYFTVTSNSSAHALIPPQNNGNEQLAMERMNTSNGENVVAVTTVSATSNAKNKFQGEEKNDFSPISVIEFPCDNDDDDDDEEDEITSPFQHNPFYTKGCKRKLMSKVQRTKNLARLEPVRLEDRIALSEYRAHGLMILESSLQIQREFTAEKKAIALLQLLKATMSSHDVSKFVTTEHVLLGFLTERFIEGNVSNYIMLQEAKDWIKGETKDIIFESQNNKLTYIKEMEKGIKWLKYNEEETREVVLELEYEIFTSLIEEMLVEFYL